MEIETTLPVVTVHNVSTTQLVFVGTVGGIIGSAITIAGFGYAFKTPKKTKPWLSEKKDEAAETLKNATTKK